MNWGVPVAWLSVIPLYQDLTVVYVLLAGTLCWTIVYDTEYGCQDRTDDIHAGVKSTALLFGDHVRAVLVGFATVFVGSLVAAGVLNNQTWIYYVVSVGGSAVHFVWQFRTWDVDSPADCGAKFKSNHDMGYLVFAGLLLDYVFRHWHA